VSLSPEDKIKQLENLVEADPEDHLGFFMLGKLYLDTKQYEEAASRFERCLELKPDYSAAWRFAGDAHRLADQREKAREVYERGIEVANANGDLQTVKEMQAFLRKLS
jgi:uncharacterized protein HemY